MELDVTRIGSAPVQKVSRSNSDSSKKVKQRKEIQKKTELQKQTIKEIARDIEKLKETIDAEKYFHQILDIPSNFNKRLKFSIDEKEVVVKVVDSETDKVIKEIPPEEMRNLHKRIREAVGLLVDETV